MSHMSEIDRQMQTGETDPRPEVERCEMEVDEIRNCARCGMTHRGIRFEKLIIPVESDKEDGELWTHWTPCPVNGQPILLRAPK